MPLLRAPAAFAGSLYSAAARWAKHRALDSNARVGVQAVNVSQFSAAHLDPRFDGTKDIVRAGVIRPEIAFDDDGRIVDDTPAILEAES